MSRTYRCCNQKDFWIVDGNVYCKVCNKKIGYIPSTSKEHQEFLKEKEKEAKQSGNAQNAEAYNYKKVRKCQEKKK